MDAILEINTCKIVNLRLFTKHIGAMKSLECFNECKYNDGSLFSRNFAKFLSTQSWNK